MREYSHLEECVNNLPYAVMILLGTAILALGPGPSPWACVAAGTYLAYGLAGTLWIIVFLCPYCRFHGTRNCPCGYGRIAATLRPREDVECFAEKFRKHIPVIVPLWFIPLLVGVVAAVQSFSWWSLGLLIIFGVDAFAILPVVSTRHGCAQCPQRDDCPWMGRRRRKPTRSKPTPP